MTIIKGKIKKINTKATSDNQRNNTNSNVNLSK